MNKVSKISISKTPIATKYPSIFGFISTFIFIVVLICLKPFEGNAQIDTAVQNTIDSAVRNNNRDQAILVLNKIIAVSQNNTAKEKALYELGRIYIEKGDYVRAYQYLNIGLNYCIHNKNQLCKAFMLLELGRCQQFNNEYVKSLNNLIDGYSYMEFRQHKPGILRGLIYLADYYRNLAKFKDAVNYMHAALSFAKTFPAEKSLQIQLYNRSAAIHSEIANVDSSLYFSYLALSTSQADHNFNQQATSLNEIAFMYENTNKLNEALIKYKQAVELWKLTDSKRYWVNALGNVARVYQKLHNYKKSNEILLSVIDTAINNRWYSTIDGICGSLMLNYEQLGDLKSSYYYRAKSLEAKFSVFKDENARELEEIKTKYQSERNELLLKKQQRDIEIANFEIDIKEKESIRLWVGFFLVVGLCLFISYLLIQRSKNNKQLNLRNLEIEKTNEQLKTNLRQIESLMQEVHHRVKNNLQFIYSILELEIDSNQSKSNMTPLVGMQSRIMAMSLVHELLYTKDTLEKISSVKYITQLLEFLDQLLNTNDKRVKFDIDIDDIPFDINQSIAIGMIVNELVNNTFKHAFAKQNNPLIRIKLKYTMDDKMVQLEIEDNGVGYNQNTQNTNGLGLRLINIFTAQLNGTYQIDSHDRFYFTFNFPIN